eukprot:SAG11_NODE_18816_length_480_cov_3.637795_1_plen_83_part_01
MNFMAWRSPIVFKFFWLWIRRGNVPLPGTLPYLYGDLTGTYFMVNSYKQYRVIGHRATTDLFPSYANFEGPYPVPRSKYYYDR